MKIIVSAGGTGGHIYPALAIINKFKEKESNLEVLYNSFNFTLSILPLEL